MKTCSHCGQSKELIEFYRNTTKVDGLDHRCKDCARVYSWARYHKKPRPVVQQKRRTTGTRRPKTSSSTEFNLPSLLAHTTEKQDGCLEWNGKKRGDGYPSYRGKTVTRLVWTLLHGSIAPDLLVCHKCDNPPCINPEHLFLGTNAANQVDSVLKGRRHNVKLSPSDVKSIREAYARNTASQYELAKQYGVARSTIASLLQGDSWSYI